LARAGYIPPAAATPTTGSRSRRNRRLTQRAAARPLVSGTATAWRTVAAAVSDRVRGRTALVHPGCGRGRARWTPTMSICLAAAVACGSSGSGPCPAAPSPCPRQLPQGPPRVRAGGRRAVDIRRPSKGPTAADTSMGHRVRPVRVCRTPTVRTAVIPEAADGQSADISLRPSRINWPPAISNGFGLSAANPRRLRLPLGHGDQDPGPVDEYARYTPPG
jgi:hypothetical protein